MRRGVNVVILANVTAQYFFYRVVYVSTVHTA